MPVAARAVLLERHEDAGGLERRRHEQQRRRRLLEPRVAARRARDEDGRPEPSVTTTRAAEFIESHWIAMKTPMPAKTNVPPRNPRTRTSTERRWLSRAAGVDGRRASRDVGRRQPMRARERGNLLKGGLASSMSAAPPSTPTPRNTPASR